MNSNVRAFPMQPTSQDWVWDGAQWCDGRPRPPPCPPSGHPTPCPPWFPPPAGQPPWYPGANGGVLFSADPPPNPVRGSFWWDGLMLHLFDGAAWVDIGPQTAGTGGGAFVGTTPPANPVVGTLWWNGTTMQVWDGTKFNPIYGVGVTDGSSAMAGIIGEVLQQTTTGTVSVLVAPGAAATTFAALTLTPGDWDMEAQVRFQDITSGCYFNYMLFSLNPGGLLFELSGNFTGNNGFVGGTYPSRAVPVSVSVPTVIQASLQVIAVTGSLSGSATYSFLCLARRRR